MARGGGRTLVPLRRIRPAVASRRPLVDAAHRRVHRAQALVLRADGGGLRPARRLGGELDGNPARGRGDRARPSLRRARDGPVPRGCPGPRLGVVGADGAAARRRVLRGRRRRGRRRHGHAPPAVAASDAGRARHLRAGRGGLRGITRRPGAIPRGGRGPGPGPAADPRDPAHAGQPSEPSRMAADRGRGAADGRAGPDRHLLPARQRPARPHPRRQREPHRPRRHAGPHAAPGTRSAPRQAAGLVVRRRHCGRQRARRDDRGRVRRALRNVRRRVRARRRRPALRRRRAAVDGALRRARRGPPGVPGADAAPGAQQRRDHRDRPADRRHDAAGARRRHAVVDDDVAGEQLLPPRRVIRGLPAPRGRRDRPR